MRNRIKRKEKKTRSKEDKYVFTYLCKLAIKSMVCKQFQSLDT